MTMAPSGRHRVHLHSKQKVAQGRGSCSLMTFTRKDNAHKYKSALLFFSPCRQKIKFFSQWKMRMLSPNRINGSHIYWYLLCDIISSTSGCSIPVMKLWVAILANPTLASEQPMSISWIKVSVYLPHWSNGLYLRSPLKRSKPLQHSPGQQVSQVTQYHHTSADTGREEVKTQDKDISESLFQSFFHKVSCFQTEILKSWQKSTWHKCTSTLVSSTQLRLRKK